MPTLGKQRLAHAYTNTLRGRMLAANSATSIKMFTLATITLSDRRSKTESSYDFRTPDYRQLQKEKYSEISLNVFVLMRNCRPDSVDTECTFCNRIFK